MSRYIAVTLAFAFIATATTSSAIELDLSRVVFTKIQSGWQPVHNLSYESFSESVLEGDKKVRPSTKLIYSASGLKYEYKLETKKMSGEVIPYQVAFDGEQKQWFTPISGILSFKKLKDHDPDTYVEPLNPFNNELFLPFISFTPEVKEGKRVLTRLNHLQDAEVWSLIEKRTKVVGKAVINGLDCVQLEVQGSLIHLPEVKSFLVSFSIKDDYYPVAWTAKDASGKRVLEYFVDELGKVMFRSLDQKKEFVGLYPKKSRQKLYEEGALFSVAFGRVDKIKINYLGDEDQFSLDPSIAKVICDLDNKRYIPVPK